jgi:hypothetical protein
MNLYYASGFRVGGTSGASRATQQKAAVLGTTCAEFKHFYPHPNLPLLIGILITELRILLEILKRRPDVFLSRGYIGFVSIPICRIIGITVAREIHADSIEEAKVTQVGGVKRRILKVAAYVLLALDKAANKVIFNNDLLRKHYIIKYRFKMDTLVVYNGYQNRPAPTLSREEVLAKFNLPSVELVFLFAGSAAQWHGVEYLNSLNDGLAQQPRSYVIVCAGGDVSDKVELGSRVINITPLDSEGCDELIAISDVCLLPVKQIRASPGSPLKLYDYIFHRRFVLTVDDLLGYSDEVMLYRKGLCIDFNSIESSVEELLNEYDRLRDVDVNIDRFSWESRMAMWLKFLKRSKCRTQG